MYLPVSWGGLCGASGLALSDEGGQRSGLKRGAGGIVWSFRPGSVRRRRAEVRPEAGDVRLVGRAGVLGLTARCVGLVRWKRSASPKPSQYAWVHYQNS